jgi:O-antigen ligase
LLVLGLCGAAAVVTAERRRASREAPVVIAVTLFLVATILSSAGAGDVARSFRLSLPLLPALLVFLLGVCHVDRNEDVAAVFAALAVCGLALGARVVLTALLHGSSDPAALVRRVGSPLLLVPNDVVLLAIIAPLSLGLLGWADRLPVRVIAASSLAITVTAILATQSRLAVLILVGTSWCFAVLRVRRVAWLSALGMSAAIVVGEAVRGWPLLQKHYLVANPRLALWATALAMFRDAPWLGHGPHTFGLLRAGYLSRLTFPSWLHPDERVVPWAHNLYLECLAERGLVGFVTLIAVVVTGFRGTSTSAGTADEGRGRWLRDAASVAFGGFCVAAFLELTFLRQWVVLIFFTLLGVVGRRKETGIERSTGE